MDLALNAEQLSVRDVFHGLFTREATSERVRQIGDAGFDPALWRSLSRMGALGIAVPESDGGEGAGLTEAALVCEQAGRHVAAVPYVEACVTSRLLSRFGSPLARQVTAGAQLASFALHPSEAGRWRLLAHGAIAHLVIGLDEGDLVAVVGQAQSRHIEPNLADLPLSHWDVADGSRIVLASGAEASLAYERSLAEWRALAAATLTGIAAGALEIGVNYVKDRKQFGVPLATFQSIGHGLADCHASLDGSRLLTQEAVWALDNDTPNASVLATMAYYFAAQTAETVTGKSLHFHGGYGFMLEYDVQLYYRRAKAWSLMLGDREMCLDSIASYLASEGAF
jgi:alkylation response protein AidB-like acyl-CoA dehydrogenase